MALKTGAIFFMFYQQLLFCNTLTIATLRHYKQLITQGSYLKF